MFCGPMSSRREGRQIRPLRAREIRGHVVRDVCCTGHGRSAREARASALVLVPNVRRDWGCYPLVVPAAIGLALSTDPA